MSKETISQGDIWNLGEGFLDICNTQKRRLREKTTSGVGL